MAIQTCYVNYDALFIRTNQPHVCSAINVFTKYVSSLHNLIILFLSCHFRKCIMKVNS